jgi:DNA-binding MarR family transcriptional regulator
VSSPAPVADPAARLALLEQLSEMGGLSALLSATIAARAGITPTDLESLDLLRRHGPMTAGRLAELTGLTTGAITGMIDRLERRGYARREADPSDRRRVIVRADLERAGQDLEAFYVDLSDAITAIVASYSDRDLAVIADAVGRVNDALRDTISQLRHPDTAPATSPRSVAARRPRTRRRSGDA